MDEEEFEDMKKNIGRQRKWEHFLRTVFFLKKKQHQKSGEL